MWWILRFPDFFTPLAGLWQSVASLDIGTHLGLFLFAGLIPGTNIEISFTQIAWAFWLVVIILICKDISTTDDGKLSSFKLYIKPN